MARYQIITLIDITRTNPHRSEVDNKKISQQANFNSLLQAIGMRSNVSWVTDPKMHTGALPSDIDGKANHWIWTFDVERDDVFLEGDNPVALLVNDLNGVPIIDNLDNSITISPAAFQTNGKNQNTWLTIMS
jgi:hypothetical protein